jgi:hypothetical protein
LAHSGDRSGRAVRSADPSRSALPRFLARREGFENRPGTSMGLALSSAFRCMRPEAAARGAACAKGNVVCQSGRRSMGLIRPAAGMVAGRGRPERLRCAGEKLFRIRPAPPAGSVSALACSRLMSIQSGLTAITRHTARRSPITDPVTGLPASRQGHRADQQFCDARLQNWCDLALAASPLHISFPRGMSR